MRELSRRGWGGVRELARRGWGKRTSKIKSIFRKSRNVLMMFIFVFNKYMYLLWNGM